MTTDPRLDAVLERGARRGKYDRGHRLIWVLLGVILLGTGALALAFFSSRADDGERDRTITALSQQAADNARDAHALAEQVKRLGGVPVVQPELPAPAAEPRPARGIKGTAIDNGHLVVTYTDGASEDKGPVVGPAGTGGAAGRGIVGSGIVNGHLVLSYSDTTTEDVGPVVGPKGDRGRGISSSAIVDGRLVLTYDDGTTQDLGPLPVGRGVKKTEVVACRWRVTYTDGVTEDAGNACTTQTETQTQTVTPTPSSSAPSTTDNKPLLPAPPS